MRKIAHNIFFVVCIWTALFTGVSWADTICTDGKYYNPELDSCVTCETPGFIITTNKISANAKFSFLMSAKGSFVVDWGDGTPAETINRTDTAAQEYTHTYTTPGVKEIKFCGMATEYNSATGDNVVAAISFYRASGGELSAITPTQIVSVSGSLGAVFPTLGDNTNQQPRFRSTFQNASNLTTISATLFDGVSGSADGMFRSTFDKCSNLKEIPYGLFDGASGGAANMFRSTFYTCTSLKKIPDNLFAGITKPAVSEFKFTFYGNSGMTNTYIPASAFSGFINNAALPAPSEMWDRTFDGTGLSTSCSGRVHQISIGYEGTGDNTWKGKVACGLNNSCVGATYYDSGQEVCVSCPSGYDYDKSDTKSSATECQIRCPSGTYLANANDSMCSNVGDGYYASASVVNFGSTSSRSRCPHNMPTNTSNATDQSQCIVYCQGTNYRDAATNTCMTCPTGYKYNTRDGKTSVADCQIHCDNGTYLPTANASSCVNVGDGFWATESTINYGGTSMRTQCPDGEMTGTLNASSASQCIALCPGATYHDSITDMCLPCPMGYNYHTLSGKTAPSDCQIHCVAGTYIANINDTVCTNVGDGYYASASNVNYGSVGTRNKCPEGQLTGSQTATDLSQCKTSCQGATYYNSDTGDCDACPTGYTDNITNGKNSINQCQRHCAGGTYTETYTQLLYLESDGTKQFIDTGYGITSDHVHGTAFVEPITTMSGQNSDSGNFFGNLYGPGGFSSNYKKGTFGLWIQTSGSGKKAEYPDTFEAGHQYKISFDVSVTNNLTTAKLNVNDNTQKKMDLANAFFDGEGNTFKLFTNGSATNHDGVVAINWGDKLFTGRIHSLELYDGDTKVLDLIPVRRESDSALGVFNRITNEFYGNSGLNNFTTAETDTGISFVACSPVGNGYYVQANDTNYGLNGKRNRCPNGAPTMVNDKVINNADSIYKCDGVEPCMGATYPNPDTGICTLCPTKYDFNTANWKESIDQCQTHCYAGTYLANAYDEVCMDVGDGYYADETTINYGDTGIRTRCANGGATGTANAADESECQEPIAACTGATYTNLGVCVACPAGYDYNTNAGKTTVNECQLNCAEGTYLATTHGTTCTDAGVGYWATGGAVNYGSTSVRTACAAGLTTVGYGHGADEASDCGRVLHIGDNILYSKTTKTTNPALNIQVENGPVYYVGVGTTDHTISTLHISHGNQQYTAFDDSLLYGERDFGTNTRIQ